MSLPDAIARETAASPRWLSIVGIGEDGVDGLGAAARGLIGAAEIVFGGRPASGPCGAADSRRGAALAEPVRRRRPTKCSAIAAATSACSPPAIRSTMASAPRSRAASIAREMLVVPAPSAFSLAAARLGWSLPHDRAALGPRPHPRSGAPASAARRAHPGADLRRRGRRRRWRQLLADIGFGASRLTVLEALGGPRERIRATTAAAFDLGAVDALNTVAIEVEAAPGARVIARTAGLADDLFEHDGQITKREVRAVTLSSLAPRRGELLWDIGAGSGAVAIEWMLADPLVMRAVAIERQSERAARIRRNAAAFGVPDLEVVEGAAPAALAKLAPPDAIFIGGGAGAPGVIEAAIDALRSRGRLVVNAVTLETEAMLIDRHKKFGGELTRIAIARAGAARGKDRLARGDAGDAMAVDQTMIVAGVGCRRGAPAPDIETAIRAALARAGIAADALDAIATPQAKRSEAGIKTAAEKLGVRVMLVAEAELKAASARTATRSERVLALIGVPSVAEAAALAAAGPSARLLSPRLVIGAATCALAASEAAP